MPNARIPPLPFAINSLTLARVPQRIHHPTDAPHGTHRRTRDRILEAGDQQRHEKRGERLKVVGVCTLGTIEEIFRLVGGSFGGGGVGVGVGDTGGFTMRADYTGVPYVDECGGSCG